MKKLLLVLFAMAISACANADWSDDFESYTLDSLLAGQGGWAGWDGGACAAIAGDDQAIGTQAAELFVYDDLVQEFDGYDVGHATRLEFVAWQYISSDNQTNTADTFFILMNNYNVGGDKSWSGQIRFDLDGGLVQDDMAAGDENMTLVYDQWVEIKFEIDLMNNVYNCYYNGQFLSTNQWYNTADPVGKAELSALDLWADAGVPVYYDDLSLTVTGVPEPGVFILGGLGLVGLLSRKKK